jgi:subtilisin-like proprotein convertase family protein
MRGVIFLIILFFWSFSISSQEWTLVEMDNVAELGIRDIKPSIFKLYAIDEQILKNTLFDAPYESEVSGAFNSQTQIQLPTADGRMHTFAMVSYHLLHPDLQKQFPDIKAFYGICLENAAMTVVADYSPTYGFRAVVSQPGVGKTYIDHFQRNDLKHRIVYYRKDYQKFSNWKCGVVSEQHDSRETGNGNRALLIGDCMFREYRLALACTGEYATFHGGTIAGALAGMNTTMNRVNGVFAQEIAIRCVIISNNTSIMYTNGTTDPFNNNDGVALLDQNQINTTSLIGTANYDIGHIFSTGGGGVAQLRSVCVAPNGSGTTGKARGVTGSGSPVGDPFDIDYVAHEMGHQLGANHTQNNSCQRNNDTAMEPGSASSIMGYAGICSPDVQSNSDENYHAVSLGEIKSFLAGVGSNCDIPVAGYSNAPPNISAPTNNTTYNIPRSTPFALTMTATDPNGNGILYGWDQMNNDIGTMPPLQLPIHVGPMFRFIEPTTNPTRYFPNLTAVLSGATVGAPFGGNNWEVLPSVARTMNFRGVARDVTPMSASCNSEVNVIVNTVASAGPFTITSQNSAITWPQASQQVVTWDVAGTTTNGVNCQQVDLLWTTNSGDSFTTLLQGVANDGSQNVEVPSSNTTTGRVLVKAFDNVFFDINNANITINTSGSTSTFNLGLSHYYNVICQGNSQVYTITVSSYNGFSSPVTLSVSGLPAGISANFSNTVVTPGTTAQLTVTNTSGAVGNYTLLLNGISGAINKSMDFTVGSSLGVGIPTLTSPANNATNIGSLPSLTWAATTNATTYQLQISRRPDFNSLVLNELGITTNSYTVVAPLSGYSEYYWRVRALNSCGTGDWSSPAFKFDTEACMLYSSTDVPKNIIDNTTITSNLLISDKGTITDLDVIDLEGTHSYINDLRFNVISPANTNIRIWNRPCNTGQFENFDINFNQGASVGNPPCPPTNNGTYRPSGTGVGSLNTFNTQSVKGNWSMTVQDFVTSDDGVLQTWRIRTCMTNFCRLTVDNDAPKGVGSLKAALDCAVDGDTIRFASTFINDTIMLFNENIVINKRIYIEGDISKNIHLMSSSTSPTIVSTAPNTGFGLKIKGLHIHSSNATNIGAIQNSGLLNLEDVYLYKSPASTATIQQNAGGINNISGDCRVLE